jgi:hypothetical protein
MKICAVGAELFSADGRMKKWTDRQTSKLKVSCRKIANAPKKDSHLHTHTHTHIHLHTHTHIYIPT